MSLKYEPSSEPLHIFCRVVVLQWLVVSSLSNSRVNFELCDEKSLKSTAATEGWHYQKHLNAQR